MSVKNVRCPACQANGRDTGSDNGHLYLMKDGDRWCCTHSENHDNGVWYHLPNDPETNTPIYEDDENVSEKHYEEPIRSGNYAGGLKPQQESPFDSVNTTASKPTLSFGERQRKRTVIDFRGVPAAMWEEFGVEFEVDENGEPIKQFYPVTYNFKPRTTKVRVIEDKEFYWEDSMKGKKKDLFGMGRLAGRIPKRVLLTEGEIDAVSAEYMLKKYNVKCLSGTDGDSLKDISQNAEFLGRIENLTFCPDADPAGNEFCEKVVSLLPDIKVMQLPEKDANLMLTKGKEHIFVDAYFRADNYRPPSIVEVSTIKHSLKESVPIGISYPWSNLDAITYGINPHTILSIGSGPGAGKTTVVRSIQEHLMFHHELPVGIFSLEESKELTLRHLVGYQMNQRIHLPGSTYDVEEAMHHAERLEGKAFIYDRRFFNGKWEKIEKSIRFMYASGIKHFFIDPITALVVHLDASGQNTALGKIMSDLSALMQELPIYVMLVNHLNNPTSGPGHDEGGRVLPSQFTGSKSQWRFSTDMWGIERNSLSEDEEEKNTVIIRNLKHRTDGDLMGRIIKLKFNKTKGKLVETHSEFKSVVSGLTLDKHENVSEKHIVVPEEPKIVKPSMSLDELFSGGN